MVHKRPGFTLIEVSLAVVIGIVILAASVAGFNGVKRAAKFSQAKSMVGTVQTNLAMEKFRTGSPPPVARLQANRDSANRPFWPDANSVMPNEPITGQNAILPFDSTATPVPLAAGAPSPSWDNPIFLTPGPAPGYGKGGWLYDPATGAFRLNLSNQDYPDQRPGAW